MTQQILALKSKGADTLVDLRDADADDHGARHRGEGRLDADGDVHRQRLGEPDLHARRGEERRERRRRHLVGVRRKRDDASTNLAGVKLAQAIVAQYAPSLQASFADGDANIIYGLGVAWTFVYALQNAGKNPTRAGLMTALHNLNTTKNPFLYPGIKLQTSREGQLPDRAGDHGQVGRRRDRRLAAVRQAPQRHPLTRRTS